MRTLKLLGGETIFVHPALPEIPLIEGMFCEDHFTFAVDFFGEGRIFSEFWQERGLTELPSIQTKDFRALHIGFVEKPGATELCGGMIGASKSTDTDSPINKLLRLYGKNTLSTSGKIIPGALQHIAYGVAPERSMDNVRVELETRGVTFMTPIITHRAGRGTLKQMFVACSVPWGPFVEILQRTELPTSSMDGNGQPVQNFFEDSIDQLYEHYDAYSHWLIERK